MSSDVISPTHLTLLSPAKINLFLHVTGQRADGYHRLETVFQFLDFYDTLQFQATPGNTVIREDEHNYDLPSQDLIIQAARLLSNYCNLKSLPGVKITLTKNIPPGSGMGGGSSNAATTLLGLNKLWELGLSKSDLLSLAQKLGADVPIFVHGLACWAEGIGDEFSSFTTNETWYCIYIPAVRVSTEMIFQHPDLPRNHKTLSKDNFQYENTTNDLQPITRELFPEVNSAFELLERYGSPRMNGSGSSIFLACDSKKEAEKVKNSLPNPRQCVVTKSLNCFNPFDVD
jgi:4-diphosphocytidyl-2-C-methyl-D-erythritol kinase